MKDDRNMRIKLVNIHTFRWLFSFVLVTLIPFHEQAQTWSLKQCIDTALVYNKSLQISKNVMAIGDQKQKEAKANQYPKINIVGDYKYFIDLPYQLMPLSTFNPSAPEGQFKEAQFGVAHNMGASIQVAMPIYNPQIYGGIRATEIAAEIAELQYRKTEEQIIYEVTNLYMNAQIQIHQLSFIDSNIVNARRLHENLKILYQQLMIKETDVLKVRLQLEQLMTQKEMIENSILQIMNTLKLITGQSADKILEVETQIKFSLQEYENSATIDLQLVNSHNMLLVRELKTLQNSKFPTVSLYGSYGQTGFGYDKEPNQFLKYYPASFVGAQFSYPLFNGTVTNQKINQKKLEIQNSQLQIGIVTDQNIMLIENTKRRRSVSQKAIANSTSQINLASIVYDQTLLQQKQGIANLADVLLANNALREAQQNYLSAIVEFLKADLELKKLSGILKTGN